MDGIIFDKDGTLFDFQRTWAEWSARLLLSLTSEDRDAARHLGHVIGFDLETRQFAADSPVIAGTPLEIAAHLLPHLPGARHESLVAQMNLLAAEVPLAESVPLRPLLEGLRARGLKIGLATNDAEAPAFAHLRRAEVLDLFDFVAGCDSGYGAKPSAGQLLGFCAKLDLAPETVVMVGDSLHDLVSGQKAGMQRIAVLTGIATEADLAPHADAVLPDIGHLPAWLDAQQPGRPV